MPVFLFLSSFGSDVYVDSSFYVFASSAFPCIVISFILFSRTSYAFSAPESAFLNQSSHLCLLILDVFAFSLAILSLMVAESGRKQFERYKSGCTVSFTAIRKFQSSSIELSIAQTIREDTSNHRLVTAVESLCLPVSLGMNTSS